MFVGLKRRGYSANIINAFCRDIGATRNENHVQIERLFAIARSALNETAERVMAVLDPIRVKLVNLPTDIKTVEVPNYPQAPERGSHTLQIEDEVFIDAADFRLEDDPDYFGMAKDKLVGLKYIGNARTCIYIHVLIHIYNHTYIYSYVHIGKVKCTEVVMKKDSVTEVDHLVCTFLSDGECSEKPKGQ